MTIPVTQNAITNMLSIPNPDQSTPPQIIVQIVDFKPSKKRQYTFCITDGITTIDAVLSRDHCPQIDYLQNFGLIKINNYAVNNLNEQNEQKCISILSCDVVAPSQGFLFKERPIVPRDECVTHHSIDTLLANKAPVNPVQVQVLDLKVDGKIFLFTASDGKKKIRALINFDNVSSNSKSNSLTNLGLIRIFNYYVVDIPHSSSAKYLVIRDFQPIQSCIDWEIKEWEFKVLLRLKQQVDRKLIAASPSDPAQNERASSGIPQVDRDYVSTKKIAIFYDALMLKHKHPSKTDYPDKPTRVSAIWKLLLSSNITSRCFVLDGEKAAEHDLLRVHSEDHINWIKWLSSIRKSIAPKQKAELDIKLEEGSLFVNDYTSAAAFLAAGTALKAAERVASSSFDAAVAIVRPPGHHAEANRAMGFCFLNNIAVSASYLLSRKELKISKILIVDWDVHFGNGTQKIFYNDPNVLFFSIHRYGKDTYPFDDDCDSSFIGEGKGAGYNINVPWEVPGCTDSDYIHVWNTLLLPVVTDFRPDIILVSAGFDAAEGDAMGGCRVTPHGFATLTQKLMNFADGRIVLVLEGGYSPKANAASMEACIEVLLGDSPVEISNIAPSRRAIDVTMKARRKLQKYWPCLARGEELDEGGA